MAMFLHMTHCSPMKRERASGLSVTEPDTACDSAAESASTEELSTMAIGARRPQTVEFVVANSLSVSPRAVV